MIPRQLLPARCSGGVVRPGLIDPENELLLGLAERLLRVFRESLSGPRWALEELLEEELSLSTEVRVGRGVARVLEDRCEFETLEGTDPPALRDGLFKAAARSRLAGDFDRGRLMAEQAQEHASSVQAIERELFADLPGEQLMMRLRDLSAVRLLHRYNVALVQAVLMDARALELEITRPSPNRLRQLLASLKFHRLLFSASWPAEDRLVLKIDGPMSMFESTRRYGLQMALFLPSVLLCEEFELVARLRWGRSRRSARLELSSDEGLVSHYPDRGMWVPEEVRLFPQRFDALQSGWQVSEANRIFNLQAEGMAVPDLQFIPAAGGPPIYLELLGHWRKRSAEAYLRRLARHGPARYLVAISEKLCVDPEVAEIRTRRRPIWFKNVLLPRQVLRALEQLE